MKSIFAVLKTALMLLVIMTLLTGVVYPLFVLGVTQLVFNSKANGSLIEKDKETYYGSRLLGQSFTQSRYFWGRPSATTPPYNAAASAGSNFSPANPKLQEAVDARIAALQKAGSKKLPVPADLVTASASGLDPHISLSAAEYQVPRVAKARQIKEETVRQLVTEYTRNELGEAYVNVLLLNLALDKHNITGEVRP